jgi:phosphoribosylformylglycinamidine cyclo-ligase
VATYRDAGVDIEAGDRAVQLMKSSIAKASRPEVVGSIGGFAGLFDASALKHYSKPLLATSTDGVGTKTDIARQMGIYDTIGEDLVAMVVDDLVVCGAEPLFMTDYIAVGKVFPERIAEIVKGIASGCQKANTALIGGETAEHPGLLEEDEFDIAGAATGVVDAPNLLSAEKVKSGDLLLAMPANGFHSNGYALIRHILATKKLDLSYTHADFTKSLGEELLTPTEIYTRDCLVLIKALGPDLRTFAHITGGGLANNTARVIPAMLSANFDRSTWSLPLATQLMADLGGISQVDFESTWNCGVGMVAVIEANSADLALKTLSARGMRAWIAGEIFPATTNHQASLFGVYRK